ncbi:unnamed protein product [Camellia sinensis]
MQPLPLVVHFNQLLTCIARMKHYSTVISLFKEIRLLGITVDYYTMNIVINCLCHLNRVDYGFSVLGSFFKRGYVSSVYTFSTLMNGFILQDKAAKAMELFNKLVKEGEIKPNQIMYGTIINGLCKTGNSTTTVGLLRSMQKWNYKPNVVMYTTTIDGLCKDKNVDGASCLLGEMTQQDVAPNVITTL